MASYLFIVVMRSISSKDLRISLLRRLLPEPVVSAINYAYST
jgi:hypothetical protein